MGVSISPSLSFEKYTEEVRTVPASSDVFLRKAGATFVSLNLLLLVVQTLTILEVKM